MIAPDYNLCNISAHLLITILHSSIKEKMLLEVFVYIFPKRAVQQFFFNCRRVIIKKINIMPLPVDTLPVDTSNFSIWSISH